MNLLDDFFILIWGDKFKSKYVTLNIKNTEEFLQAVSILLCINPHNINKISKLKSFQKVFSLLSQNKYQHEIDIKVLQNALLKNIKFSQIDEIKSNLNILAKNKIISHKEEKKLISLLELIIQPNEVLNKPKIPNSYHESIDFFANILSSLDGVLDKSYIQKIQHSLTNQSFYIGITGVMNAGKSTMLNALLNKEILGTSNIPETANLSILRYAKTSQAKVNFWNIKEWEEIEKSAKLLPQMQKFVDESKEYFSQNLNEFITEKTKTINIQTNELSLYTSAKNPTCNLVKSVELYEDLEFLQNGVCIVDTPGLDDPVVQREEITKQFLSNCDVLIHLMNVNQSATQKDVDFIIHSLTYGHVTRLLIVLTRIDTINEDELKEVIAYTKSSIKQRLIELNNEAKFNQILQKIEFLPIAGKMALLHRTNRKNEALKLGYDLQKTGILQIEEYLKRVLFGKDSEKNQLFLQGIYSQIKSLCHEQKELFLYELKSLNQDENSLKIEFEKLKKENLSNLQTIQNLEKNIETIKQNLQDYLLVLKNLVHTKLLNLKNILSQRIFDDVNYELKKHSKKPTISRLTIITQTTIKDGIVDIVRDYRYEFEKKMQHQMEQITSDNIYKLDFDCKEYFDKNFKGSFFSKNFDLTQIQLKTALDKTKKSKLNEFMAKLDEIFSQTILDISNSIFTSIDELNQNLINGFLELASKPLVEQKQLMKQKEQILLKQINLLNTDEKQAQNKKAKLSKNLQIINQIITQLMDNKNEFIR